MASTQQILATPEDVSNNPLTGRVISYVSSNPAVATVDNTGLVTAVGVGSCNITVTCELKTVVIPVTVVSANTVSSITVTPTSTTLQVGATVQTVAAPLDSSGNPVSAPITWSSSDITKATVDNSGLVTAIATGSATITAANGAVTGTSTITVVAATARQLWWEADSLALTNNTLVSSWLDQVIGDAAKQTTNFNKPTYKTAQIGGLPGVDFELNAILNYTDIDAAAFTRLIVATIGTSTPVNNMVLFSTPMSQGYVRPNGSIVLIINKTGGLVVEWQSAAAAVSLNTPHVFEFIYDASALTNNPTVKLDGTAITVTLFGGVQSGTRNSDAGNAQFGGDASQSHEILGPLSAYVKYPDITDHSDERHRLGTKYGITVI